LLAAGAAVAGGTPEAPTGSLGVVGTSAECVLEIVPIFFLLLLELLLITKFCILLLLLFRGLPTYGGLGWAPKRHGVPPLGTFLLLLLRCSFGYRLIESI
jgi:hypothetical protein